MRRGFLFAIVGIAVVIVIGRVVYVKITTRLPREMSAPVEAPEGPWAEHGAWLKAAMTTHQHAPSLFVCTPRPVTGTDNKSSLELACGIGALARLQLRSLPSLCRQPSPYDEVRVSSLRGLAGNAAYTDDEALDAAQHIRTDYVYNGTIDWTGDNVHITGKIRSTSDGALVTNVDIVGPRNDPAQCAELLSRTLVSALKVTLPENEWSALNELRAAESSVRAMGRYAAWAKRSENMGWDDLVKTEGERPMTAFLAIACCDPPTTKEQLRQIWDQVTPHMDDLLGLREFAAYNFIGDGEYELAEQMLRPALRKHPDNYVMVRAYEYLYEQWGEWNGALAVAERLTELHPQMFYSWFAMRNGLWKAGCSLRQGRTWGAMSRQETTQLAETYAREVHSIERGLEIDPKDGQLWRYGIDAYGKWGDYAQVWDCFLNAREACPADVRNYDLVIYYSLPKWLNRPDRIHEVVQMMLKEPKLTNRSTLIRIVCTLTGGKKETGYDSVPDAILLCRRLANVEGMEGVWGKLTLAMLLATRGEREEARRVWQEGLKATAAELPKLNEEQHAVWHRRLLAVAWALQEHRITEMTQSLADEVLRCRPKDFDFMTLKATSYWAVKDYDQCGKWLNKVKLIKPDDDDYMVLGAVWEYKTGDRQTGLRLFRRARRRGEILATQEHAHKHGWCAEICSLIAEMAKLDSAATGGGHGEVSPEDAL